MQQVYNAKENCCGCSACAARCPERAISMQGDAEGFLYPHIDRERCVDCGACRRACPFLREGHNKNETEPILYAASHRDADTLARSTSGGAFTALSDVVLGEGGIVYGADFDEHFTVRHVGAETPAQRDRLRVSKYAQSDLGEPFAQVMDALRAGRSVLFTGTPCQVAGLSGFIGPGPLAERLILCDLICHSIPSPLLWQAYLGQLEAERGAPVREVYFRTKDNGWSRSGSNKGFTYLVEGDDRRHTDDRFYQLFFGERTICRPSCARCPFTDRFRPGDLTIADYWGIEKYAAEWAEVPGVSSVFVSTDKGAALFERAKAALRHERRDLREQLAEQPRLSRPGRVPEGRSDFWSLFAEGGFAAVDALLRKKAPPRQG